MSDARADFPLESKLDNQQGEENDAFHNNYASDCDENKIEESCHSSMKSYFNDFYD